MCAPPYTHVCAHAHSGYLVIGKFFLVKGESQSWRSGWWILWEGTSWDCQQAESREEETQNKFTSRESDLTLQDSDFNRKAKNYFKKPLPPFILTTWSSSTDQ